MWILGNETKNKFIKRAFFKIKLSSHTNHVCVYLSEFFPTFKVKIHDK